LSELANDRALRRLRLDRDGAFLSRLANDATRVPLVLLRLVQQVLGLLQRHRELQHGGGGGSRGWRARVSRTRGPGERARRRRHRGVDVRLEGLLRCLGLASRRLAERGQTTTKRRRLLLKRLHLLGRGRVRARHGEFRRQTCHLSLGVPERRSKSKRVELPGVSAERPGGDAELRRVLLADGGGWRVGGRVGNLAATLGGGGGEGGDAHVFGGFPRARLRRRARNFVRGGDAPRRVDVGPPRTRRERELVKCLGLLRELTLELDDSRVALGDDGLKLRLGARRNLEFASRIRLRQLRLHQSTTQRALRRRRRHRTTRAGRGVRAGRGAQRAGERFFRRLSRGRARGGLRRRGSVQRRKRASECVDDGLFLRSVVLRLRRRALRLSAPLLRLLRARLHRGERIAEMANVPLGGAERARLGVVAGGGGGGYRRRRLRLGRLRCRLRVAKRRAQSALLRLQISAKGRRLGGEFLRGARRGGGHLRARAFPRRRRRRRRRLSRPRQIGNLELQFRRPRAKTKHLLARLVRLVRARRQSHRDIRRGIQRHPVTACLTVSVAARFASFGFGDARLGDVQRVAKLGGVRGGGVRASSVRGERRQQTPFGQFRRAQFARHPHESRGVGGLPPRVSRGGDDAGENLRLEIRLEIADGVRPRGRSLEFLRRRRRRLFRRGGVRLGDARATSGGVRASGFRLRRRRRRRRRRLRRDASARRGGERLLELGNASARKSQTFLRARAVHHRASRQSLLRGHGRRRGFLPRRRARVERRLRRRRASIRRGFARGGGA